MLAGMERELNTNPQAIQSSGYSQAGLRSILRKNTAQGAGGEPPRCTAVLLIFLFRCASLFL